MSYNKNLDSRQILAPQEKFRVETRQRFHSTLSTASNIVKNLYFALIYPRILYAVEIYANTYITFLHDLIILNNRILRILQHKPRLTRSIELYSAYNTLPVSKLFQYQILLHAYKLLFCPELLPNIFHYASLTNVTLHSHNTRTKLDFHRTAYNTPIGSKVSYKLCAKFWNFLPLNLKEQSNFRSFKYDVKKFLLTNDIS